MKLPNLDTLEKNAGKVVCELLADNVRRATAFISPTFVISANRRFRSDKRASRVDFVMKVGAPNFRERQFIKLCQKSGVAFPLRNVQLKFYPTKAKTKRARR